MAHSTVQSLQNAVRHRLWRGQFVAAARLALWGSAGLLLLAVAVHLAARPVRVATVLAAIVALWTAAMAWATVRRPPDSACALWADRHLGGASAFSTLLELREAKAVPDARAMRWLEHWAQTRVPDGLRLLGARHEPARLARPLLSALVCTAFATLVLTLSDTVSVAPPKVAAATPSGVAGPPIPTAIPPVANEVVSELASALRTAESRRASERRDDSRAPAAGADRRDVGTNSRIAQPEAAPPGGRTTPGGPQPGAMGIAAPAAGAMPASVAGLGRDAGDSSDDRADAGASPVPRGTIQVQRRESSERRPSLDRQADPGQLAAFDADRLMNRTASEREEPTLAAATPPPATDVTLLTPTRAAYVQAWMKASRQRR